MSKYISQVDKYLKAQQVQKIFLAENQKDLFFLRQDSSEIFLYHLDLSTQPTEADLGAANKVCDFSFAKCQFEFIKYFPELNFLYFSMDEKNNEFSNLYKIDLNSTNKTIEQITSVKAVRDANWTKNHERIYFLNRYPIENGLFRSEIYQIDLRTKKQKFLFDDKNWDYKVGWLGFQMSACETFFLLSVDQQNRREFSNVVKIQIDSINTEHPDEFPKLLPKTMEDGSNVLIKTASASGFYFLSDYTKFENLYFYNFNLEMVDAITDESWINVSGGSLSKAGNETFLFAQNLKETNQTKLLLVDLKTRKSINKILQGNYIASFNEGYLLKNSYDEAPSAYIYDQQLNLGQKISKFSGRDLVHCTYEVLKYKSFDGLEIFGYFIKPLVPIKAVAVIAFYGGDNYYHFHDQLLLENGYAIFSPAVRGSWGWGRNWEDHLKLDLGGKEILDVIWAAKFISKHLEIPENRIGVWGKSHGGYATLRALTIPSNFANVDSSFNFGFGICECGFADLEDFYKTSRIADWLVDLLGSYPKNIDLYKERSPENYFKNLTAPLFLRHGTTDTRVPLSTVQGFITQLEKSDIKHQIMIQEDQGHHTNDPEKHKIERAAILDFLDGIFET